jgi:hypothetical protein
VDKGPKGVPCPSAPIVQPPCVRPHIPAVMRKAQGVIPLGLLRRKRDQRFELRIAAHDAIQGDEICRTELRSKAYKIAVAKMHPGPVATALRFRLGRGDIEVAVRRYTGATRHGSHKEAAWPATRVGATQEDK